MLVFVTERHLVPAAQVRLSRKIHSSGGGTSAYAMGRIWRLTGGQWLAVCCREVQVLQLLSPATKDVDLLGRGWTRGDARKPVMHGDKLTTVSA